MHIIEIIALAIIAVTFVVTFKGFNNRRFFDAYKFHVDPILVGKEYVRLISSGFLHANWLHFGFNMGTLYVFSQSLGYAISGPDFLIIYFASLLGGDALALYIHRHHGDYSAIGASGAVSGVVFAFIAISPGAEIGVFGLPLHIPSWLYGLAYVLITIFAIKDKRDNIGHDAHLGGALFGILSALLLLPDIVKENATTILLIGVPIIVFLYLIVRKPEILIISSRDRNPEQALNIDQVYNDRKHREQKELDGLLEKIKRRGIASLSTKEKQRLEELSK